MNKNDSVGESTLNRRRTDSMGSEFLERRREDASMHILDSSLASILNHVMETNELLAKLTVELNAVKVELKEHMENEELEQVRYNLVLKELLVKIEEVSNLKHAFIEVDGELDLHGHKQFHKGEVESGKSWNIIKQNVKNKLIENIVMFILFIFGLGLFAWFNQMQIKNAKNEHEIKILQEAEKINIKINPPLSEQELNYIMKKRNGGE